MPNNKAEEDFITPGTVIRDKWSTINKIGEGGFGQIYTAYDIFTKEKVAIKVESRLAKKQLLKMEVTILKKLKNSCHICKFYGCGRQDNINFVVMGLKGQSISFLRKNMPLGTFTISTTLRLLFQMIEAIETVHNAGYIHRDIKPSNFVIGKGGFDSRILYILDFGLAKPFLDSRGNLLPRKEQSGFRGTVRYASINAHKYKDLSKVDDLWSALYVAVEMITGHLPWKRVVDRDIVGKMKIYQDPLSLVYAFPKEFIAFILHLQSLSFFDRPDYSLLKTIIKKIMHTNQISLNDPFDWEIRNDFIKSVKEDENLSEIENWHFPLQVIPTSSVNNNNTPKSNTLSIISGFSKDKNDTDEIVSDFLFQ